MATNPEGRTRQALIRLAAYGPATRRAVAPVLAPMAQPHPGTARLSRSSRFPVEQFVARPPARRRIGQFLDVTA